MKEDFSRRDFFGTAALAGAGLVVASCSQKKSFQKMSFVDKAPDGQPLKAGLIGCGGRGTGAAENFLKAGPNLSIVALADLFQDKMDRCKTRLESKYQQKIAPERMYLGFDAYKKMIDSDVDLVLIATPPFFRPIHFDYAVEAKKHIFMEKPVGVDPVSIRALLASGEKAKAYNLCVVTGTQRRHQRQYLENYSHVKDGAIGKILAARCYWNQGQLWFKQRQKEWSDMEAMLRDWVNWSWLSGDHIVEQHVHNIDVINWFVGAYPVKAVSMGGRMRRVTGDQYDFFSTDFTYENGMHLLSQCRQIDGCANEISEYLVGSEGSTNCRGTIWDKEGKIVWQYQEAAKEQETPGQVTMLDPEKSDISPYDQEHVDLVTAIRTNKPINEAENTAKSTLTAIMARISAYTGKESTWEQMMSLDLKLGPTEFAMGPVPSITATVPVPGTSKAVPAAE